MQQSLASHHQIHPDRDCLPAGLGVSGFSRWAHVVSGIECGQPEHEEFYIADTPELRSECLYLGVERFGSGICEPPLEIVYNSSIVVLECFKHFVEFIVSESFDFVIPSGKVQPCGGRLGLLIENYYCPLKIFEAGEN